ncbi:UDP-N-acetylglucosamine transporter UGNT1 isoform X3 [Brassica rapa]|uniref:UDP-N-acetylglucosamine transporter UGNT1 isoform X3 n=1 Tax=Brassica campestris TaxID=3711 RepID=UPI000871B509|nr:UDP-N-acetylglucosamine transporter UGNT1 isoform X3 [Brassica rapa]
MMNPVLPVSDPPLAGENNLDGKGVVEDNRLFKGSAMTKRGTYAALSYMACAVMLVLFNKAALSSYHFPCVNVITLFQMVSSTLFLYTLRRKKIISFTAADSDNNVSAFVPLKTLFHTLPLSAAYLLYMLATMASVRGVNVPMYTTLRRTTVAFTMVIEYLLTGQRYTRSIIGRDLSFDFYGYGVVFLANITTAVYLATISRTGKSSGLNSFGLMWCNGIICGPILMIWTYVCGDLERTINFPHLFSPGFMVVLLCSCVLAFFLNYSIFLNTTLNSALTQTICGNMKDVFTVGLGWLLFGGLPFDLMNVIGQLFGFFGSGLYAYYKIIGR